MYFNRKQRFCLLLILSSYMLHGQVIWSGDKIVFEKLANTDWTLAENQDRITEKVWITRQDIAGIFNFAIEASYFNPTSPGDTEWAFGTTSEIGQLTFNHWRTTIENNPPSMLNRAMVVHLISEDIYIDITFLTWDERDDGGGFSYERSSNQTLSNLKPKPRKELSLVPNPSSELLKVYGINQRSHYKIIDPLGRNVLSGVISRSNNSIAIGQLQVGRYFLILANAKTFRFMKY